MLVDLLIIALASAFAVSFLDRWLDSGIFRGVVSLVMSIGGVFLFGYTEWGEATYLSLAAAFSALLLVLLGERMATPLPMLLDSHSRRE